MFKYDIRDLTPGKDVVIRWKIKNDESLKYYDVVIPWEKVDDIICNHWDVEDEDILEDDDLFFKELATALAPGSVTPMPQQQLDAINEELQDIIEFYVEESLHELVESDTIGYGE